MSRILSRARLSRWRDLHPRPPVIRYEHPFPGDLLHLDIKGVTRFQQVYRHPHPAFGTICSGQYPHNIWPG